MRINVEKYLGQGVNIPFKRLEKVYDTFNQFFSKDFSFNRYDIFLVRLFVMEEEDSFNVIGEEDNKDTFVIECKYPYSKLSELLIVDSIKVFVGIIVQALSLFYEHFDLDVNEIDTLRNKLNETLADM